MTSKEELCWSGTVSSRKANCKALGKHLPSDYRDKSGLTSALKMWLVLVTEMKVGCSDKTCWLADFQKHWAVFDWLSKAFSQKQIDLGGLLVTML